MKNISLLLFLTLTLGCNSSKDSSSLGNSKGWFSANKMFIADTSGNTIRTVDLSSGVINAFAGNGSIGFSADNTTATSADMGRMTDLIAVDDDTVIFNIYSGNCVQMVDNGVVTKIAGTCGTSGFSGDGGQAVNAEMNSPLGLCMNSSNDLFISTYGAVRKVNMQTGVITTVLGTGSAGNYQPSHEGQQGVSIQVSDLGACKFDKNDNMYVGSLADNVIYKLTPSGVVTTIGQSANPGFNFITGMDIDLDSNVLYVADNSCYRTINLNTDSVSTYMGNCSMSGSTDISGANRQNVLLTNADAIQVNNDKVYYANYDGERNINVISENIISNFVGTGTQGSSGNRGPAVDAEIGSAYSLTYYWD